MDEDTSTEIKKVVRDEADSRARSLGYVYLVMIVTVICACAASLLTMRYLNQQSIRESERKLCAIVILSDDTYHQNPPTSDLGRKQAVNFSNLRRDLGCKPYKGDPK